MKVVTGGLSGPPAWPRSPPVWPGTWSWPGPGWCSTGRPAAGRTTSGEAVNYGLGRNKLEDKYTVYTPPTPTTYCRWFESNCTEQPGLGLAIWEPCNYVSNLAYDRLVVEMCHQQDWSLQPDIVKSIAQVFIKSSIRTPINYFLFI